MKWTQYYNVITNFKPAMAKRCLCEACDIYTTKHVNVTNIAPCVRLHRPVRGIKVFWYMQQVVSKLEMFSESFDPQSEGQASLSV